MFSQLPNELILHIIYHSCTYAFDDSRTLWALSLISHKINKLMHDNRAAIIEYYTVIGIYNKHTQYICCGLPHRDNDQPAVIYVNGTRRWYQHGRLHRNDDLPAEIWDDGTQNWYQHGYKHRDNDRPAVIYNSGVQMWYQHGKLHRDNDLPAVIYTNGTQMWYQHGKLHRDNDLPAVIYSDGAVEYWINDKRIR